MKTFRNVVAVLGLLLFLYVGAYWRFAREDMRLGYALEGRTFYSHIGWDDWRKLYVPIISLDYRMNVERPFWKRSAGHWQSADSDDFVTLSRKGQCSFLIGEFQGTGEAVIGWFGCYGVEFVRDEHSYVVNFNPSDDSGVATTFAVVGKWHTEDGVRVLIPLTDTILTPAETPD